MRPEWDPEVVKHLEHVRRVYSEAEVVIQVQTVVNETWRANLERWSPLEHFDDASTLGFQTSRNVNNRLMAMHHAGNMPPGVMVETESGIVVLRIDGYRLRIVKAPIDAGSHPDFQPVFDWSGSRARAAAAGRNQATYFPIRSDDEWTLTFETDPRPNHLRRVERCRDIFLVWAGALNTSRTVGWLGLPTLGDLPWMGIVELWSDNGADAESDWEDDPD